MADVAITKTDAPDPVAVGSPLTYTLTAINNGPSPATGVTVTDTLPANVTVVSATPSQGTCTPAGGTVTCVLGTLASGASATVTIQVTPTPAAGGTTLTNTATVIANEPDPNPANNTATATTAVTPVANLAITKTDAPDPVAVGSPLTYTLTATNNGPSPATGVTVTDTLPANVTFVSATPSQGTCTQAGGTVTCPLGALASGASATVTIQVTPTAAAGGTTLTNTAQVTANEADPNPANNTATATTAVTPAADLAVLSKTDNPDPVPSSSTLTYTITVANFGPSAADNVQVTDPLPPGTFFSSATTSQGSCPSTPPVGTNGTVTCNLGTMASGGTATVTIVVQTGCITTPATRTNTATVSSPTLDPNPGNNTASQTTVQQADLCLG